MGALRRTWLHAEVRKALAPFRSRPHACHACIGIYPRLASFNLHVKAMTIRETRNGELVGPSHVRNS